MTLTEQKKQALELYVNQSYTQQQIANALGVTVRTIHNWVKQHAWDRLRLATHQAPALIADNFSSQLVELQNSIAAREPGKRIPTTQEMEIMRKLTVCINNTKKTVSLPQVTQMMRMFRAYVFDNRKKEFASIVADVIDGFLEARSRFGYAPYELEFGIEKIQHLDPLYNPYHETIAHEPTEPPKTNPTTTTETTAHKTHTVDTSKWSPKVRQAMMTHFADSETTDHTTPEEQALHASIVEKLKPVLENEIVLNINDLATKTQVTTGNKPENPATQFQPTSRPSTHPDANPKTPETISNHPINPNNILDTIRAFYPQDHPSHPDNLDPAIANRFATILKNEIALTVNDLASKTHESTGNKPEKPESFLQGLRNAFLQNHPLYSNKGYPYTTSKNPQTSKDECH